MYSCLSHWVSTNWEYRHFYLYKYVYSVTYSINNIEFAHRNYCIDTGAGNDAVFIPPSATCTAVRCHQLQTNLAPHMVVDSCTQGVELGSVCR